jgi:hypothetical protein
MKRTGSMLLASTAISLVLWAIAGGAWLGPPTTER